MAGPASNFDNEIKQAMSSKSMAKGAGGKARSSNDKTPDATPGKNVGTFNMKPKASPAQPNDQSDGHLQGQPGGVEGPDTHGNMIAAGQAHMDAIHAHINSKLGMGR